MRARKSTSKIARVVGAALALGLGLSATWAGQPTQPPATPADRVRPAPPAAQSKQPALAVRVLSDGALVDGWTDLGWAPRMLVPGRPARVDFSGMAGWILSHPEIKGELGGLFIRLRKPPSFGDFLEVSLDSRTHSGFPRIKPAKEADAGDGWSDLWVAMSSLNPLDLSFDRLVLRGTRILSGESVEIAVIGFTTESPPTARERAAERTPARKATVVLDCRNTHRIDPMIYGVGFGDDAAAAELGASARRWGGNPTSRYNWKLGNAWNTGADWFFRNVVPAKENPPWDRFLAENDKRGMATAFTLPTIGWVAKDTTSCGFPTSDYPEQKRFDPDLRACGDGVSAMGNLLPSGAPATTSERAPPGFIADWVRAIRAKDQHPAGGARLYFLDNEPTLWHVTHRDVHPERVTYDELLTRTLSYGGAVRAADPEARIGGFVSWGWPSLFYSAADRPEARPILAPDRLAHGRKDLLPWWLSQLREHDAKTGKRSVDLVDVHFYPQATGVGIYSEGWTDPESCARRIRSVRALWDPTYKDESWIAEPINLIPRIREWIDKEYPGLGISIGEYNFGAEGHISSGLAVAEALGRFGVQRVDAAFYWSMPPKGSPPYWAFRAFRNYDGAGAKAGDVSVRASLSDPTRLSSVFATRKSDGGLVLVALNHEPQRRLELKVDASSCGALEPARMFSYAGEEGLQPVRMVPETTDQRGILLQPWSINVLELRPRKTSVTKGAR